jgi:XapX domain-containing protein
MRSYLFSFAAGLLVGCIYSLIKVRSPAPPLIALIGLLGILLGEQSPSLIKHFFLKEGTKTDQASDRVEPHTFSQLTKARRVAQASADPERNS